MADEPDGLSGVAHRAMALGEARQHLPERLLWLAAEAEAVADAMQSGSMSNIAADVRKLRENLAGLDEELLAYVRRIAPLEGTHG